MIGGRDPFYQKFWIKVTALERNRRFFISFFARSDSPFTRNEKSSIKINRNPLHAFQWAQDEHCTLSL